MPELLAFLFFVLSAFFASVGIVAIYRYLWNKIAQTGSNYNAPEPPQKEAEVTRDLELEAELRSLREMAEMLALEQQRMRKEAALVEKVRKVDSGT
ncbi:MAG: hypothetical protein OXT69_15280 [Candidatus Poribacteria bacterium]|nr:hypothetical protein [Candidatus Poribacteria bacterium]